MVEVRLHGELAREFGMRWDFEIDSPREAFEAIDANRPGFRKKIAELEARGMCFRVRSKDHDYDNDDVGMRLGSIKRIDIIPIVMGSSAALRFVVGAVILVAGNWNGGGPWTPYTNSLGLSLMLGSVVEWLTPVPKRDDMEKRNAQSWTFSGPTNTVDQGLPVPVIYGEVLTGGYTISGGISISQLNPAGSADPSAFIGGQTELGGEFFSGLASTQVMLSVGTVQIEEPFTYAWSYTGFEGATVSMTASNTATVKLQVNINIGEGQLIKLTGNVTCVVGGRIPPQSGAGESTTSTVSATQAVTVSFYGRVIDTGGGGGT